MKFTLSMLMLLATLGVAFYFGYKLDFKEMERTENQGQAEVPGEVAPAGGVRVQHGGVNFGSTNGNIGGINTGYRPAQTTAPAHNCIQGARC